MTTDIRAAMPRAADPRPARTRAQILAAIENLAIEHREITVASIVARAGISRSTFYSQFSDIGDVAIQLFREIHEGVALFESRVRAEQGDRAAAAASLRAMMEELEARRHLYAAVLGTASSSQTIRSIRRIMSEGALRAMTHVSSPNVDAGVTSTFIGAGILAVLIDWLLENDARSGDEVASDLLELIPHWLITS